MGKAIAVSVALCSSVLLLGRMYYKTIRHEFYQVWDTISDIDKQLEDIEKQLKGEDNETSEQRL